MNNYKNIEIIISTILFMFLFGYFRTMILGQDINFTNIILTTLLFYFWYLLTTLFTNRSI